MVMHTQLRIEHVANDAPRIDEEGYPPGNEAKRRLDPISRTDLSSLVADERHGKAMFGGEAAMRLRRVTTDPDHLGPRAGEVIVCITKGAGLARAARGLVLGIEKQNHVLLPREVGQLHQLSSRRGQLKLGSAISNGDHWRASSTSF